MAVQFILGGSGTGKSHRLYQMMTERAFDNQDMQFVAIVPEQYSMESQKEIVNIHKRGGAFNTEVVSFNRLAYSVFEEMNLEEIGVMDDLGKIMVLRRVLGECKNDLKLYSKKVAMPGFVDKIKSTISELEQYDIDEEKLEGMIKSSADRKSLRSKLADIAVIYKAFNSYVDDRRLPQEMVLSKLCQYIPKSKKIKNSQFFIDGFTGFTPIQKNVVDMLIKYAANVTFAFTLPEQEADFSSVSEQELFRLSKKTITDIKRAARERGVEVLDDIVVPYVIVDGTRRPYRASASGEISHIEQNIFRSAIPKVYEKENRDVTVHVCENPRKEATFVASMIRQMMIEQKDLRYSDIAVITPDMDTYHKYIEEEFERRDIPNFIDHKKDITDNPYVDSIGSLINLMEENYSYEAVMHFLRLYALDLDRRNIDIFENYIIERGKKGHASYLQSWDNEQERSKLKDIHWQELDLEKELERLKIADKVRQTLVDCVEPVKEKFAGANVEDRIRALYEFTLNIDMQMKLEEKAMEFEQAKEYAKASEYRQTYKKIIELFDKMYELLGPEKMSRKEFLDIFNVGIQSIKVGIIPAGMDTVMVGDMERTRLKDIKKIVFLVGVNDTNIPKKTIGSGIISDVEREFLEEKSFILAPTARDNAFTQKLYLYLTLTKPSERLVVCFSKTGTDGKAARPAYIISNLETMFKTLKVVNEQDRDKDPFNIVSSSDALKYLAGELSAGRQMKLDSKFGQVYATMASDEKYREIILSMLDAAFYRRKKEELNKDTANQLYGSSNIGITRLERYAACAYAHYLENGLKLQQRKEYEFAAMDLGNVYHNALDMFCRNLKETEYSWSNLPEKMRDKMVEEAVEASVDMLRLDVLSSSARNAYIKHRVLGVTKRTVEMLGQQLREGEFIPKHFEYKVKHGRIDRVDEMEKSDRIYVKIIDYKSGNKEYSLQDVYYGLSLQLMVYMKDTLEEEKKQNPDKQLLPGGAYYFHIDDPVVQKPDFPKEIMKLKELPEYSELDDKKLREIVAKNAQLASYKMSGPSNTNDEFADGIDINLRNTSKSNIVEAKAKSGHIEPGEKAFSTEDFTLLLDYTEKKAGQLEAEIKEGIIEPEPKSIGKYDSCTYCAFKGVCGFDRNLGDKLIAPEKMDTNTIVEKMKEYVEGVQPEDKIYGMD